MEAKKSREISALANVVRETLELPIPVDVYEAVKRLGGTIVETSTESGAPEATIRKAGERFEITIRHHSLQTRKRFTVAHELGHLFLHMGYLVDPDAWCDSTEYQDSVYHRFGYNAEEAEANLFAAAFLMPEFEFQKAVVELAANGKINVRDLAQRFRTSAAAALKRGKELGLINVNAESSSS